MIEERSIICALPSGYRIRIDRESEAIHDLILWLDEPELGIGYAAYMQVSFSEVIREKRSKLEDYTIYPVLNKRKSEMN
jgi:hypothetical protein